MLGKALVGPHVPIAECFFAIGKCLSPRAMWLVLAGMYWDEISNWPAEDDLGGG